MEFLFDTRQISYIGAAVGIFIALCMLLFCWLLKGREWGFVLWTWAASFMAIGQVFGSVRAALGSAWGALVANVFFVFAIVMVVRGARFFAAQDTRWRLHFCCVGIMALTTLATMYLGWRDVWRPVVFVILQTLLFGELFWILLWRMPGSLRASARFLAVVAVSVLITFALYAWAAVQLAANAKDVFAATLVSATFLVASALPLLLLAGFVYMQVQSRRAKAAASH